MLKLIRPIGSLLYSYRFCTAAATANSKTSIGKELLKWKFSLVYTNRYFIPKVLFFWRVGISAIYQGGFSNRNFNPTKLDLWSSWWKGTWAKISWQKNWDFFCSVLYLFFLSKKSETMKRSVSSMTFGNGFYWVTMGGNWTKNVSFLRAKRAYLSVLQSASFERSKKLVRSFHTSSKTNFARFARNLVKWDSFDGFSTTVRLSSGQCQKLIC